MRTRDDSKIRKIRVNGERRIEVWSQHIRFSRDKWRLESIGLPNSFIADQYCKRWATFKLAQWIYPGAVDTEKDVKWSQDFLRALVWVMGKDK